MNRSHFCHLLQLQDEDYCFPQVLQNSALSHSWSLVLGEPGAVSSCAWLRLPVA